MKQNQSIMGMPITVEILDAPTELIFQRVFDYFRYVDEKFSTYKSTSEISQINRGELKLADASTDMQTIFKLAEQTKKETNNFFDIHKPDGSIDPSGIVKGWAIYEAAKILDAANCKNYFIDVGSDIQVRSEQTREPWRVGIRNPFEHDKIVKVVLLRNEGLATSGTAARGAHIYNPNNPEQALNDIVSLSVIGPNVYEADRFATAAFAMGRNGIYFIEKLPGLEAYQIDSQGQATYTANFERYVLPTETE